MTLNFILDQTGSGYSLTWGCDIFCPCFKACGEWIGVGGGGRETHKEVVVICQGEMGQTGTRGVAMPVGNEFTQATQFWSLPSGMSPTSSVPAGP